MDGGGRRTKRKENSSGAASEVVGASAELPDELPEEDPAEDPTKDPAQDPAELPAEDPVWDSVTKSREKRFHWFPSNAFPERTVSVWGKGGRGRDSRRWVGGRDDTGPALQPPTCPHHLHGAVSAEETGGGGSDGPRTWWRFGGGAAADAHGGKMRMGLVEMGGDNGVGQTRGNARRG